MSTAHGEQQDGPVVIINADDFGLTNGVCDAIAALMESGGITSTTLMTAAPGALNRIKAWTGDWLRGRAGVHLQLSSGSPLSRPEDAPSVHGADGFFADPRSSGDAPTPEDVLVEWRCQVEAARDALGCAPTHIDSHHGMHRRTEYFDVYVALASEFGLAVRGGSPDLVHRVRTRAIRTTTGYLRDWSGSAHGVEHLKHRIAEVASSATFGRPFNLEVVTHPGVCDDDLIKASSMNLTRQVEYEALRSLGETSWLDRNGYVSATFESGAM